MGGGTVRAPFPAPLSSRACAGRLGTGARLGAICARACAVQRRAVCVDARTGMQVTALWPIRGLTLLFKLASSPEQVAGLSSAPMCLPVAVPACFDPEFLTTLLSPGTSDPLANVTWIAVVSCPLTLACSHGLPLNSPALDPRPVTRICLCFLWTLPDLPTSSCLTNACLQSSAPALLLSAAPSLPASSRRRCLLVPSLLCPNSREWSAQGRKGEPPSASRSR